MRENTNKAIAINSVILYIKLAIITITGLLTTRFALKALGVTDFGLFSVIGGIISFVGIFNTIMLTTSNRFLSVAIGRGIDSEINEQFNINLSIHTVIAVLTLLVAIPLGDIYIYHYINFDGDIESAITIFHYTIIGAVISFIGVPFTGFLVAKEKFLIFSIADSASHILKMLIAYILIFHFDNKLSIYAFTQAGLTAITSFVYFAYCWYKFGKYMRFRLVKNVRKYKEILGFSSWVAFGAFATIGRNQGAVLLVNAFFNTAMNTALGLANSVNMLLTQAAGTISQPMAPQITKSYASGNIERTRQLLVMSTKYTFVVMLVISTPFLARPEWLFTLWLGQVPPYVIEFSRLIIIDALVLSLNSGISNIIFASGKIKLYQVAINSLRLLSIVAAFIILKNGAPAYSVLIVYILFSLLIIITTQIVLHVTLGYSNSELIKKSYVPTLFSALVFLPFFFIRIFEFPFLDLLVKEGILLVIIYFIALSKTEKDKILLLIKKIIKR